MLLVMDCHSNNTQPETPHCVSKKRFDLIYHGSLAIILLAIIIHFLPFSFGNLSKLSHNIVGLLKIMWWGILAGTLAVGLMNKIPRDYFHSILGHGNGLKDLIKAAFAGVLLDLCSHGILMVGAKLYERGVSTGQVMTFLIASPWNSITLTLILFSLIGVPLTLVFIAASVIIAVITGWLYNKLISKKILPENPYSSATSKDFDLKQNFKEEIKGFKPSFAFLFIILKEGWSENKMVIRWLFLGTILASLIQTFVSTETLSQYFGPTIIGLFLTLLATTFIEVCSEGSTPIGAELVNRANAPGNGFVFLMAGVSTDYTEMMVLKEVTKSWRLTLFLPLLTVPQILLLGWLMNLSI
jgi:uncharacterized membrane protein YraQ (UPF0718 family)